MAEVSNDLLYEVLKSVQKDMRDVKSDVGALKIDMRSLKGHMASFMVNEVAQDTTMAELLERIERIEDRLELREQ
jgi:hypothetical protein